jgi:hypothetical protein
MFYFCVGGLVDMVEQELTLEQEKTKSRGQRVGYGFSISDCPLWLYRTFVDNVKTEYNDIYWVKLMDLMRKAEAYDVIMSGSVPVQDVPVKSDVVEEEKFVQTMGGKIKC